MRSMGVGRPLFARAAALLGCAGLLAGCASMPSSGEVRKVGGEQHADADPQVRVFGVKPQKGESALQIVRGFLEATTSDEADYAIAKEYLTKDLAQRWDPFAKITVLSGGPSPVEVPAGTDRKEGLTTVGLSGNMAATVDRHHAYTTKHEAFQTSFHLVRADNEWRIDAVDDGLVLTESDFQRIYHSVNMYYFAKLATDRERPGATRDVLIADPVYLRRRIDPLVSAVSALLGGPTGWLAPVVSSAVPGGASLYADGTDKGVSLDDSQHLRVRLDRAADRMDASQCRRMAVQLLYTAQTQASARIASVELQRANGGSVCTLSHDQAQSYAPESLVGPAAQQFFIDSDHRLVALAGDSTQGVRAAGPFGDGQLSLASVAVKRDERVAAGVKSGGRELYVADLAEGAQLGGPVLTSAAHTPDEGLSAPSWDGYGNLWVADRDPARPRLLMLRGGTGAPIEVAAPDLGGGRIESLRVASDGVRIAMLVSQNGRQSLRLGRIERGGTPDQPNFAVTGLRMVTPQLEDVTAASWAGGSRLVVVGRESGGLQQIQYVNTDGSVSFTPTLPGIGDAVSVAASEDPTKPLLAAYKGGVYRLPSDANWKEVAPKGTSPVYPG